MTGNKVEKIVDRYNDGIKDYKVMKFGNKDKIKNNDNSKSDINLSSLL